MKWYPGPEGDQRIWYDADEIEQISRATPQSGSASHLGEACLRHRAARRGPPGLRARPVRRPPVRCSRDDRVRLEAEATGPDQRSVTSARDDSDAGIGTVGRWRATIAHEASHVYLHRYLYEPEFAQTAGANHLTSDHGESVQCLHRDITPEHADVTSTRRRLDWREVQANIGMAALLMPRRLLDRAALRQITVRAWAPAWLLARPSTRS